MKVEIWNRGRIPLTNASMSNLELTSPETIRFTRKWFHSSPYKRTKSRFRQSQVCNLYTQLLIWYNHKLNNYINRKQV